MVLESLVKLIGVLTSMFPDRLHPAVSAEASNPNATIRTRPRAIEILSMNSPSVPDTCLRSVGDGPSPAATLFYGALFSQTPNTYARKFR